MIPDDPLFEPLIRNVRELVAIDDAELTRFLEAFRTVELGKKEILLFKGDTSHHMRFVSQGCLRSYFIDSAGHEFTIQFGISGWWVNDLYSYLTQTPAKHFIQAVVPSSVLQIHRDRLEALFGQVPAVERFFRIKIQNAYVALQDRTLHAMSQPLEERYLEFRRKYRDIEQQVPQYMIASYLGATPEHLSAVRKNINYDRS